MNKDTLKTKAWATTISILAALLLTLPMAATAGDLEPSAGPDDNSTAMYTLEDIYNYLDTGVSGTKRTAGFTEPASAPGSTGHTLDEIHGKIARKCFETCEGTLNGTRWCDQGDGTVKDMTTGLVWLQDASCSNTLNWEDAVIYSIRNIRRGICGLTDSSVFGDWRLPTKNELYNLTNGTEAVRPGSPQAFTGVQSHYYWSSTSTFSEDEVWILSMFSGNMTPAGKDSSFNVWPARSDN